MVQCSNITRTRLANAATIGARSHPWLWPSTEIMDALICTDACKMACWKKIKMCAKRRGGAVSSVKHELSTNLGYFTLARAKA